MDNSVEYVLLIMNCKKYAYKAAYQKNTWLKEHDSVKIPYFHVIGDAKMEQDYFFDVANRILYVKTWDDYVSLPKKVIAAYDAVIKTFSGLKYIFKTDDDQDLKDPLGFFSNMVSILEEKKPKIHYGGHVVDVKTPYLSSYGKIHPELPDPLIIYPTQYCSGRFYTLSIEATRSLLQKHGAITGECLEDYAIGYHLHTIFKKTILNIDTSAHFTDLQI
jgi:hypothetical protein